MTSTRTTPMDGGWGWVVVGASFYHHMAVTGAIYGISVFYNSWVEDFGTSRGLTAWVMALVMFVSMGSGPLVASICSRLGHRPVVIVGALIYSAGLFCSCFAQSVYMLMILIGVVAAFGLGLQYLPCVAFVAYYFKKKLSIAIGIATAGLGVGAFVLPPFMVWLEECYTWRGAMLILSGLGLNMVVGGALLRPVELQVEADITGADGELNEQGQEPHNSLENKDNLEKMLDSQSDRKAEQLISVDRSLCTSRTATDAPGIEHSEEVKSMQTRMQGTAPLHTVVKNMPENQTVNDLRPKVQSKNPHGNLESSCKDIGNHDIKSQALGGEFLSSSTLYSKSSHSECHPEVHAYLQHQKIVRSKDTPRKLGGSLQLLKPLVSGQQFSSVNELRRRVRSTNSESSNHTIALAATSKSRSSHLCVLDPHGCSYMNGSFLSGLMNLNKADHNYQQCLVKSQHGSEPRKIQHPLLGREVQQVSINDTSTNLSITELHCSKATIHTPDHLKRHEDTHEENSSSDCFVEVPDDVMEYLNMLLDPRFATFAISSFLVCFTYLIQVVYMVDRAIEQGLTKHHAALALSMCGAGNLFGRTAVGFAADLFLWDCLSTQAGLMIICGVSTCLSTFCGSHAALHGIYGAVFGTTLGGYMTLNSAVLVDMFGHAKVDQSYGLVLIFHASGYLAGPPIAGFIYDGTKSYTLAFLIPGVLGSLAGLLLIILKVVMMRSEGWPSDDALVGVKLGDFDFDDDDIDSGENSGETNQNASHTSTIS